MRRYAYLLAISAILLAMPVYSQPAAGAPPREDQLDNAALMQKIRDLEDRIVAMEGQIRQLKSQQAVPSAESGTAATALAATAPVAAGSQTQASPLPPRVSVAFVNQATPQEPALGGARGSAAKALNPDISMIGDFIGSASFGFVVTSSVAIAGVLLVFCYLVVPSVGAMLFADRIGRRLAIGWIMGTLVSALGVYFSAVICPPGLRLFVPLAPCSSSCFLSICFFPEE